jgi:nucleotide-binding universal stress UspA family protein
MKLVEIQAKSALKNILLATDFEALASRALQFAVALADRYHAKLYAAHVIPQAAYAYARPESMERILKETYDYAGYQLKQIVGPLKHRGCSCEALLADGDPGEAITALAASQAADLIVVGTSSRGGLRKLLLGSVAEEVIREALCPVLTIGSHVATDPTAGFQSIVCAVDFSRASARAAEFAASLTHEYHAHLTLVHVVEGTLKGSPCLDTHLIERRLREFLPFEPELQREPHLQVEIGPAAERILSVTSELSADLIAMGARGAGAFVQTASHFGSIAHKVVSLAPCPVLTFGGRHDSRTVN